MIDVPLKCKCGSVQGKLSIKSAKSGNHVVCYCADCQAYARHLPTGNETLDEWGGTEIFQTAPWTVQIHTGQQHLRCLQLKPKGLHRWYTDCCDTPTFNTLSAKLPFVGLIHSFIDESHSSGTQLGPMMGYHKLEDANGSVPEDIRMRGMPVSATILVFWRIFKWKFLAGNKTSPFYDKDGKCISLPTVLEPGPD